RITVIGARRPAAANLRMARGATNSTATTVATAPVMTNSGRVLCENTSKTTPAPSSTTPSTAKRPAGRGRGGAPASAVPLDARAAARAGLHAAATAGATARA